jgi:hypothetical protein
VQLRLHLRARVELSKVSGLTGKCMAQLAPVPGSRGPRRRFVVEKNKKKKETLCSLNEESSWGPLVRGPHLLSHKIVLIRHLGLFLGTKKTLFFVLGSTCPSW